MKFKSNPIQETFFAHEINTLITENNKNFLTNVRIRNNFQ